MSAKHTPGPWSIDDGGRSVVAGADGEKWIASIKLDFGVNKIAERNANADMIAAAPELADALEFALSEESGFACPTATEERMRAALRKAGRP